jgi:hypothetical protein
MIIHVIKDRRTPSDTDHMWEAYDQNGKFLGIENRLGVFRNIDKPGCMHRGIHPEIVPDVIACIKELSFSIWWYEK